MPGALGGLSRVHGGRGRALFVVALAPVVRHHGRLHLREFLLLGLWSLRHHLRVQGTCCLHAPSSQRVGYYTLKETFAAEGELRFGEDEERWHCVNQLRLVNCEEPHAIKNRWRAT